MKKLLSISVIAALAVLPMAANADPVAGAPLAQVTGEAASAATATTEPAYGLVQADATDANLATAGYVKGAYNASMKAINKVASIASNATDTAKTAIENKLTGEAASGYDINAKTLDTSGDVSVGGNETVAGTLGVTGATTLSSLSTSGNTTVGGTLGVTGATTLTGAATLNGGATVASGTTVTASGATITGTEQNKVTITNAAIDADDTTISDLETDNFKSGVIVTTVGTTGSDTSLATEKAVRSAINDAVSGVNTASTVTTGRVIVNTNTVSQNLEALDLAVADIQDTKIPVMDTWASTTAAERTIANYTTASNLHPVVSGD